MGMPELLKDLLSHSEGQLTRQVRYIIDQLEADHVDDCASDDNEDALGYEDDEDYETENEEELDTDIVNAGVPIGENLLQEYFQRPTETPSVIGDGGASAFSKSGHTRLSSSNSMSTLRAAVDRNLPSAMKSRPKIPRTPINDELLGIARRENESIFAHASHIKRNEEANKKKARQSPQKVQPPPKEETKEEVLKQEVEEEKAVPQNEERKGEVAAIEEAPAAKEAAEEDPQTKEFNFAFQTRTKIARTPPEQQERPYQAQYYNNPI